MIEFDLEPDGYGAVLETSKPDDLELAKLLATMHSLSQKPLSSFSRDWKALPQRLVEITPTVEPSREPTVWSKFRKAISLSR